MSQTSFDKAKIKILLLEGVHRVGGRDVQGRGLYESRTRHRRAAGAHTRDRACGRAHARHPQPHAADRGGARRGAPAARRGLFLYRHEPGRLDGRDARRRAGLQRAVLEYAQRRGTRARRSRAVAARRAGKTWTARSRASGRRAPRPVSKFAAKRSASSATATSAVNSACSPKGSACTCCSTTSSRS